MIHRLPDLPYALGALRPHMSKKTLELHHGKHHAAYIGKLNKLIKGTEFAEMPLEDVVTLQPQPDTMWRKRHHRSSQISIPKIAEF